MRLHGVEFDDSRLQAFCRRNGIARLSLFGSILGENFTHASDVDVLVEFNKNVRVSLFDVGGMAAELEEMIGREVDLRTPEDLSEYFRQKVVLSARQLYAA